MTLDRYNQLASLQQSANELVETIARQVCSAYGLEPDASYEVPGDDGPEQMPNWERFTHDVRLTLDGLFSLHYDEVLDHAKLWYDIGLLEKAIMKGMEDE